MRMINALVKTQHKAQLISDLELQISLTT